MTIGSITDGTKLRSICCVLFFAFSFYTKPHAIGATGHGRIGALELNEFAQEIDLSKIKVAIKTHLLVLRPCKMTTLT